MCPSEVAFWLEQLTAQRWHGPSLSDVITYTLFQSISGKLFCNQCAFMWTFLHIFAFHFGTRELQKGFMKCLAQDWRTVQSQSFLLLLGGKWFIFFPLKSVVFLGFCVRYEKRHSNLSAHVSPAFRVKEGDKVVIGQCRLVDFSLGSIISICKQDIQTVWGGIS